MAKQNKIQTVLLILLAVALVSMGIGFATFASQLDIDGEAKFTYAKWDVKFDKDSISEKTGSAETNKASVDTAGTTLTYSVTLDPGEFYEFDVDVVNEGTFDANLKGITFGAGEDPATINSTYSYVNYTFKYDNTEYTTSTSSLNDTLAKGASKKVYVKIEYPVDANDSSKLQTEDENGVTLDFTVSLDYEQAA